MTMASINLQQELKDEQKELKLDIWLTTLTGVGLALGVIFQLGAVPKSFSFAAFGLAFVAGGTPAALNAIRSLLKASLDIDLLMVLAALAAAAVGEARDGAILLFLFSLASTLEAYAMGNTKRAVAALMRLKPDEANLMHSDGSLKRVPVEVLALEDIVIVKPGERLPIDGLICKGQSAVDQAPITGESIPVDKTVGDSVFAGTVNGHGVLELKVTKLASESTLARMVILVTEAQAQRSPSERFSDWFGQRYTIVVLLGSIAALIVFLLLGLARSEAFYKAATLLVVASPCAVVISVPAAVLSALAAAARRGVLFKGGAALEDFAQTNILALDKTGTLTEGKMKVTDVITFEESENNLLAIAEALEAHSEHPVAKSILNYTKDKVNHDFTAKATTALPGKGLSATINNIVFWAGNQKLAEEQQITLNEDVQEAINKLESAGKTTVLIGSNKILGLIGVADTPRPSAKPTLEKMKRLGIKRFAMLTGDNATVALAVASELSIPEADVYSELLPEDKVDVIRSLNEQANVAFIGDGVNDAAALVTANVGVAMGSAGTDVALEAADVALLSDDLSRLPDTFALARRTNRVIKQNLGFALGIMMLMVLITLFWKLPLPLGVIGHEGGTLLVVANGLRLLIPSNKV